MISFNTFVYNNAKLVITSLLNLICNLELKNMLSWKIIYLDFSERSNRSLFSEQVDEIGSELRH